MKMNLARFTVIITVLLFTDTIFAGGMTSSGGDWVTDSENPWFVGKAPITWCVQRNADFSRSKDSAINIIESAFADWKTAILSLSPKTTTFTLPDGQLKNLSTNFSYSEDCDKNTDLVFKLGILDSEVREDLKLRAKFVVGAAVRKTYDEKTGRGKGYIWLVPDQGKNVFQGPAKKLFWSDDEIIRLVVSHEIGHTLGFSHNLNQIMSSELPMMAITGATKPFSNLWAKSFEDYLWFEKSKTLCGAVVLPKNTDALLGFKIDEPWETCIESLGRTGDKQQVRLQIKGKYRNLNFYLQTDYDSGVSMTGQRVEGKYFKDSVGTLLDYKSHNFISFRDQKFIGHGVDDKGEKILVILFQSQGTYFDISFSKDSEVATWRFSGRSP